MLKKKNKNKPQIFIFGSGLINIRITGVWWAFELDLPLLPLFVACSLLQDHLTWAGFCT